MKKNSERFDLATQLESIENETFVDVLKKYGVKDIPEERLQLINAVVWELYKQHFESLGVKAVLLKADEKKLLITFVKNPSGEAVPSYKWSEIIMAAVTKIKKELKIGTILIKKQMCSVDTEKFPPHVKEVKIAAADTASEMVKKMEEDGLMADKYRAEAMAAKTPEEIQAARDARDAAAAEEAAMKMTARKKDSIAAAVTTAVAIAATPETPERPIIVNNRAEETDELEIQNTFEFKVDKNGQLCFI